MHTVFELAVVGFDPVVRPAFDVMPRRRQQLIEHPWVDRRGVGHDLDRRHLQHRQGSAEEPPSGIGVPTGRHEHVDDLAVLVDGPVHVAPHTVHLHIGLIHEPAVTRRIGPRPRAVV
jgi:hypothetical protein